MMGKTIYLYLTVSLCAVCRVCVFNCAVRACCAAEYLIIEYGVYTHLPLDVQFVRKQRIKFARSGLTRWENGESGKLGL